MKRYIFNGSGHCEMILNSWAIGGSYYLDVATAALEDNNKTIVSMRKLENNNCYYITLENKNEYTNVDINNILISSK